MKNTIRISGLILGLILILLVVVSCSPTEKQNDDQGDVVREKVESKEEITNVATINKVKTPTYDSKVQELLNKQKEINSYRYQYSATKKNSYGYNDILLTYVATIKGDKVLKEYHTAVELRNGVSYKEIYMDNNKKTAVATCSDRENLYCDETYHKLYTINYGSEVIKVTPLDLLKNLPYDAKIVGEEQIEGRKAIIIEYKEGIYTVALSIDNYYIFPLKKIVYDLRSGEKKSIETTTFKLIDVNSVNEKDVTIPSSYKKVE